MNLIIQILLLFNQWQKIVKYHQLIKLEKKSKKLKKIISRHQTKNKKRVSKAKVIKETNSGIY